MSHVCLEIARRERHKVEPQHKAEIGKKKKKEHRPEMATRVTLPASKEASEADLLLAQAALLPSKEERSK